MIPQIVLGPRYADAVAYAAAVHAEQDRKGTGIPYVAHLLGVSSLVLEAGGDEDLAIAGLLHDAAEDHGGEARLVDIAQRFGERVASVVRDCSDSLTAEGEPKAEWETRKREHLTRLAQVAPEALVVWFADKVHNGRAIATDLRAEGPTAMSRFNAPADRVLWYYEENLLLAQARDVPRSLAVALDSVVADLRELIGPAGPERQL